MIDVVRKKTSRKGMKETQQSTTVLRVSSISGIDFRKLTTVNVRKVLVVGIFI